MSNTDKPDQPTAQDRRKVFSRPWRIPPRIAQGGLTRIKATSRYQSERDCKPSRLRIRRWRMRNPERQRALSAVAYALSNYSLTRKPCEDCGTDRSCADEINLHPLRVVWRCRVCINARRRERKSVAENAQPESVSIVRRD
jgi:hypothetical protein